MLVVLPYSVARAQQSPAPPAPESALPDAPQPTQSQNRSAPTDSQIGTGNISGTVVDSNGDIVQGAHVELVGPSGSIVQSKISGDDGQFQFANLMPGSYRIKVSGSEMASVTTDRIPLHSGEFRIAPRDAIQSEVLRRIQSPRKKSGG